MQLQPIDGRKSFYNKCRVEQKGGKSILLSYDTKVAVYDHANDLLSLSGDTDHFTMTTNRHINSFLVSVGLDTMSKKELINYPIKFN